MSTFSLYFFENFLFICLFLLFACLFASSLTPFKPFIFKGFTLICLFASFFFYGGCRSANPKLFSLSTFFHSNLTPSPSQPLGRELLSARSNQGNNQKEHLKRQGVLVRLFPCCQPIRSIEPVNAIQSAIPPKPKGGL